MNFKKGDRVMLKWKPRYGLPVSTWSALKPNRGVVVGVRTSQVVVQLDNGDHVFQQINTADPQWAAIEKEGFFSRFLRSFAPNFSR
jgi:hypothetical protein